MLECTLRIPAAHPRLRLRHRIKLGALAGGFRLPGQPRGTVVHVHLPRACLHVTREHTHLHKHTRPPPQNRP
jgi:hypothetical protein